MNTPLLFVWTMMPFNHRSRMSFLFLSPRQSPTTIKDLYHHWHFISCFRKYVYIYIYIHAVYTCYVHHYLMMMMMMMMIIIITTVIIPNDDIDVFQQGPEHSRAFCHLSPQKGRSQMEVGGSWEGLLAK